MSQPQHRKADEVVEANFVARQTMPGDDFAVAIAPTQIRRPGRSTIRTVFQAFIGLCVLAPLLVEAAGLDVDQLPWLVAPLAVAAGVARVMALPGVEAWFRRFVPFLAAAPKPDQQAGS